MGGSSSSRLISVESKDAEEIMFVKGIRLTDKVVDRMRDTPPFQDPQSKSSIYTSVTQPVTPQTETPTEPLALKLPYSPSYASALVPPPPPPQKESVSPLVPKTVLSVEEHVVASTSTNSVPPAPPAEALAIHTSSLTVTEPEAMPLPAETSPVLLSTPAEAVDISRPPLTISDTVTSTELKAKPIESTTMPLTNDVITSLPVKAIHLTGTVETMEMPVKSSFPSTPTQTPYATISVEQAKLPILPIPDPVDKIKMSLLFDTKPLTPVESEGISTDMPPAPVKSSDMSSNLKELLSSPPSSALPLPGEVLSVGENVCPPNEDTSALRPVVEPTSATVLPPLTETLSPIMSPKVVVKEEELRKQIREELQKLLQEEIKTAKLKIQQQLEKEKAKAEAQGKAQQWIQAEVENILKNEELVLQQTLKDVIIHERKNIQDEQLLCQYYWMEKEKQIHKLEEKERDLAKQDSMYKEQLAKMEDQTANITRVTAKSFRKGLAETHKRFNRYQIKPVCSELQSEILRCYLQNTGRSLTCSSIASQYVKCVNNAKQKKKMSIGG